MIFSSYSIDTARSRTYGSWVCGWLQCGLVGCLDGKRSNKERDCYIINTPWRRLNRHQRKRCPSQGLLPSGSSLAKSQKYLTMHFMGFIFPTAVNLPHGANRGRRLVRHPCKLQPRRSQRSSKAGNNRALCAFPVHHMSFYGFCWSSVGSRTPFDRALKTDMTSCHTCESLLRVVHGLEPIIGYHVLCRTEIWV